MAAQRLPALPHLPVSRQAGSHPGAADYVAWAGPGSGAAPTTLPLVSPAAAHTVQTVAAPEIRPIAAANPLRPSFVLQRTAANGEDDDADEQPDLPSPWWAPASETRSGGGQAAGSGFDGPASIQRSTATGAPAAVARSYGASPAFVDTGRRQRDDDGCPAIERRLGSTDAAGQGDRARPDRAIDGGGVFGRSWLPCRRRSRARSSATGSPIGITAGPVVQTSPMNGTGPGATVQRSAAGGPGHVPTVQRLDPPGSSAPAKPAGEASGGAARPSEKELEELAQALFSRIRTRLRADLIHDREAKGLTFDNV